ncbi:hypothetical protein [Streptomyces sp. NPDC001530]|uniref:hypothetical protein n=1 Tax=Streptomyces sp. NPDC001530 TaxID=3364582 RepID=UPI0036A3F1E3
MAWLDRHPGRPRLTGRIYVLLGHLDQYSDDPAVLAVVRHARAQDPYPDGLRGYLTPETNDDTLGGLAFRIEELLDDNREADATALALTTADWLRRAVQNTDAPNADSREMGELMGHMHQDSSEAVPRSLARWRESFHDRLDLFPIRGSSRTSVGLDILIERAIRDSLGCGVTEPNGITFTAYPEATSVLNESEC